MGADSSSHHPGTWHDARLSPAGDAAAAGGGLADYWWIILLVVIVAVAIWYFSRSRGRNRNQL
ncbi:hypothetical protein ACFQY9_37055 [Microvirga aerilata]|uniref:hypothetical protein n=1 Tax=Microvirga aerilata TaxID=670292 RepID=UPI00363EF915